MFVAGSIGTDRGACARLVGGLAISTYCNTFPEKSINQMVCHSHKFSYNFSMFHRAFLNSIIDKHQHMHFFTFKTVLV